MKYFNPDDCAFEVLGFFEEFVDADTYKFLGIRMVDKPDRPLASDGRIEITLTEPLHLQKTNHKAEPVVVKASKEFPRRVFAMLQVISGRTKEQINRKK